MNINILDGLNDFECDLDVKFIVCIHCCLRNGALRYWYHSNGGTTQAICNNYLRCSLSLKQQHDNNVYTSSESFSERDW